MTNLSSLTTTDNNNKNLAQCGRVNVWGNLISMHLEPNKSEPNAFEGRADSSIYIFSIEF